MYIKPDHAYGGSLVSKVRITRPACSCLENHFSFKAFVFSFCTLSNSAFPRLRLLVHAGLFLVFPKFTEQSEMDCSLFNVNIGEMFLHAYRDGGLG